MHMLLDQHIISLSKRKRSRVMRMMMTSKNILI